MDKNISRTDDSNGGDVTNGIKDPQLTSYTEYNRHQGSDGFSKGTGESGGILGRQRSEGPSLT